jgi:ribose/xylose/arabinose/galactoside ABC-type transport system permease subunit
MTATSLSRARRLFLSRNARIVAVYALIVVLLLIGAQSSSRFLSERNLFNVLRQASFLGVVTLGQMLVILTAGIDLSVGSVVKLSVLVSAVLMNGSAENTLPVILIVMGMGLLIGFMHGFFITQLDINPFIVTLASYIILRGLALSISTSPIGKASKGVLLFYDQRLGPFSLTFVFFIILIVLLYWMLRYTTFGRYIYALGGNQEVARLSGIPTKRIRYGAFMLCSLLASVCGLLWLSRMGVGDPVIGNGLELDTITAVIIGGTSLFGGRGGVVGTIGGVLLLTILANLLVTLNVPQYYQGLIEGAVIVAAVALYRQDRV